MASLLTHALVGSAVGQASKREWRSDWRFWGLVVTCSVLPDIDSIGFHAGVPYSALWGHRGMTHSFLFAAILAAGLALAFRRSFSPAWKLGVLLFVITASHGVLDAMTNGGLGVAFFSPFDQQRYFFSCRPIQVSPIGISRLFTWRGVRILGSEALWIWCPALLFAVVARTAQWLRKPRQPLLQAEAESGPGEGLS
ncbi:MAG TPA: metal-dependent hydrolase [Candidatus Angelobacter sp.]|nr:metal-dependent hydrolase [Candidatus Angelobacter sp.]